MRAYEITFDCLFAIFVIFSTKSWDFLGNIKEETVTHVENDKAIRVIQSFLYLKLKTIFSINISRI